MKWYSVKKYKPILVASLTLVRIKLIDSQNVYFELAEFDNGWKDWENKEALEDSVSRVTHFCIPDPIEIEE